MKRLEEILNLPESKTEVIRQENREYIGTFRENEKAEKLQKTEENKFLRSISEYEKIETALPQVKGLGDAGDAEFDKLSQKAQKAYDDINDLAMNVEVRYSARLLEVSASMLKIALDAKAAKMDKKLKMIDLQLKKYRIDNPVPNKAAVTAAAKPKSTENDVEVEASSYIVTDRNSLLEKLKNLK